MARNITVLQYLIMYDPGETSWPSGFEFEKEFSEFFKSRKLSVEVAEANGNTGARVLLITSMDKFDQLNNVNEPK